LSCNSVQRHPPSKVHALHNIKHLLHLHNREGKVLVHHLATVVGQGVAMMKVVLPAKLMHCVIAMWKSWNDQVQLLTVAVQDLKAPQAPVVGWEPDPPTST